MDEMMKVTILQPSEKRRMLEDDRKTFLDPNIIMDARHRIFHEELAKSSSKSAVLAEARRYALPIWLNYLLIILLISIMRDNQS